MRRSPIVLTATAAGLAGVLSFHTKPQVLAPAATRAAPTPKTAPPTTTARATATPTRPATRTVLGTDVPNQYGDVQVKVVVKNGRIADIVPVALPTADPRSLMISQQAEPLLRSQAISAQSANINGVSGASYTSAGYQQSLQSALDKVGVQQH